MAGAENIPSGLPATNGLSMELWQSVQREVYMSLHDPFVQGLAQGTLDRRAFQHYVAQDAFFLKYFARAYGIALSKALALDDDTFAVLGRLLRGVHTELQLHGSYAAKWGVHLPHMNLSNPQQLEQQQGQQGQGQQGQGLQQGQGQQGQGLQQGQGQQGQEQQGQQTAAAGGGSGGAADADVGGGGDVVQFCGPSAATRAYTDFLMEVAEDGGQDGGVAEILAAMLPCSRLYGFLGCALAAAHGGNGAGGGAGGPDHEYWEWVRTYSSPEYLAIPALKEAMFDRLAAHADKAKLLSLYRRAMQLEAEFFAAQPFAPPPRRIAALVVDFDETCSSRDTIGGLLRLAEAAAEAGRPTPGDAQWARATPGRLAEGYVAAQEEMLREALPEGQPDATSYDAEGLAAFLERLSDFDERMNGVVEESGILRGSTEAEVAAAGAEVRLRPHCLETLRAALKRGIPVEVVSVNWSDMYVGAALGPGLGLEGAGGAQAGSGPATSASASPSSSTATAVRLRCNSLQVGPDGLTSGSLLKRVQTARDKTRELSRLRKELQQQQQQQTAAAGARSAATAGGGGAGGGGGGGLLVYVGDSTSDLGALLAADVGVVVGENRLLRRVAARFGVRLRPLAAAPLAVPSTAAAAAGGSGGVLYEAAGGWAEIRAFLFGVERPEKEEAEGVPAAEAAAEAEPPQGGCGGGSTAEAEAASAAAAPAAASAAAAAPAAAAAVSLPRVLSIAGSDSGGGAGIQADVKALLARGVFAMTALTALTAQNTHGVSAVHAVPPEFLRQQIDAVLSDLGADAIKTGMLPNAEAVHVVAERVRHYRAAAAAAASQPAANGLPLPSPPPPPPPPPSPPPRLLPLVVDPVLVSTSGHSLAEGGVAAALLRELLPLATLATPNLPEAEALLGCGPINSVEDMRWAARELQIRTGCGAVLVKGGHLKPAAAAEAAGAAEVEPAEVVDVLYDGERLHELRGAWVSTGNTHGTGCTLASAISAELSKGLPLLPAVTAARAALSEALRASAPLTLGSGVQRPFHHLHMMMMTMTQATAPAAAAAAPAAAAATTVTAATAAATPAALLPRVDLSVLGRQLRLYGVTDPHCNRKCNRPLVEAVRLAVRGGATIIQLREKDIDGGDFAREAAEALKVCRQYGVPLIINDRVDVALAVGADGVHVGQSDLPAEVVRAMIGPSRILGVSVKTPDQARAAAAAGADYLGAGAVVPTGTKDTDVIGLAGLAAVCEAAAPLPVVAIGGVTATNAADTIRAGCAGIAVVSAIFGVEDAEGAAAALLRVVDKARGEQPQQDERQ
ncbi:hypothetical protein PLESTB_000220200 [Pleodorina starrii]|uniref:thiamine phosphate synthase n=1 Tax=Pleodorina starrii TaxID=330485 RepID=A0A9W6BD49_9CHLO|nr:hypothetical protein PLESTM_001545900 [Pleodorina starrii]GLC49447.1 hypothetical protein PLESTB_000220200 [Pleodorina starrii]GLC75680.1 hypothetical protein PLESTF_001673200 [Pleodorina starrii]